MELSKDVVADLFFDEYNEEEYEIVDEGDWSQGHKYQTRTIVFKYNGLLYIVSAYRSGSPFTDWYYQWEDTDIFEAYRVEAVPVTTITYRKIKSE